MAGRKSRLDDTMRQKIEDAAALGCTDTEIALYCDISRDTFYRWIKEQPKLSDRIEALREKPILKARQTIINNLNNPQYALEYLKRKKRAEFGDKSEVEVTMPRPILDGLRSDNSSKEDSESQ